MPPVHPEPQPHVESDVPDLAEAAPGPNRRERRGKAPRRVDAHALPQPPVHARDYAFRRH